MKQKWISIINICITLVLVSCLVFCGVTMMFAARKLNVETDFNLEYTAPKPKGMLFDTTEKKFNLADLNQLLQQITGNKKASTIASGMEIVKSAAQETKTSENFRDFNGDDITVKLGDYTWTPTYLSTDTDENPILTLWLNNSSELSGRTYDTSKIFGSTGTATWSSEWYNNYATVEYPSAMYGTSYMRCVVLNNGGSYAHSSVRQPSSDSEISLIENVKPNEDSAFALFTMDEFGLTNYLVTPEHVSWQEDGQRTTEQGMSNNLPNENWSNDTKVGGFNSTEYGEMNYAGKTGNEAWNNDYLWLPSLTETGYNDTYNGKWKTSTEQRKNPTYSWLRSGDYGYASTVYSLNLSGDNSTIYYVYFDWAVRPALHLNLASAANNTI